MPRGIAIPQLRQQLFDAAERVLDRDGTAKLSGRAVTGEAGVATGLLHAHFSDFDDFLTAYVVDRSFVVGAGAGALPGRAGHGDVTANVCDAMLAAPLPALTMLSRLLVLRPELADRARGVLGEDAIGLDAVERAVTAYLAAERDLGRIAGDPSGLALALVSVLHRLVLGEAAERVPDRLRRVATAVLDGAVERH